MVREMDEILRQQIAQPANSCNSENGVSFLDKVITPLYEVIAAVSVIFNPDNNVFKNCMLGKSLILLKMHSLINAKNKKIHSDLFHARLMVCSLGHSIFVI